MFSTDARGFQHPATVLASVLRRTREPVAARVYTRGFPAESFREGRLEVDFVRCEEAVGGRYPRHVSEAVFDRLRIIRDEPDWDRVLVMDHDMLVFTDLAEYFREPFGDDLLMGRLFGEGNTVGFQMRNLGGLPAEWKHAESNPYFYMGPMMNLAAMRAGGFWERLLEAHGAIGRDEQISLTAACGGRVKGVDVKWNLVPQWDWFRPGTATPGVSWRGGVPEGLVHWTGPAKPWHYGSKVWRAELWESEQCDWEQLRTGRWDKPLAVEVWPGDVERARALLLRGWRVRVHRLPDGPAVAEEGDGGDCGTFPDQELAECDPADVGGVQADLLRFGPGAMPDGDLPGNVRLALEGPRSREEIETLRRMGYRGESRIIRRQWAAGGPAPEVLPYSDPGGPFAVACDEDVYLSRLESDRGAGPPPAADSGEGPGRLFSAGAGDRMRTLLPDLAEHPRTILECGAGRSTRELAELFPQARIIALEHDPAMARRQSRALCDLAGVEVRHAPIDPSLPWYDLTEVELPDLDCVVVDGPSGPPGRRNRRGTLSVLGLLKPGAAVVLADADLPEQAADLGLWLEAGLETVAEDGSLAILRLPASAAPAARRCPIPSIRDIADAVYVVARPGRAGGTAGTRERLGLDHTVVAAPDPDPSDIRWEEMRGLEAFGRAENLRRDYVVEAVGDRRRWLLALETFLASGARTALICGEDCRWSPAAPVLVPKAFSQLPPDWDLLYFAASARIEHEPFSPHLVRLRGARGSAAILWRRETALKLVAGLRGCDCEFDVFMERFHAGLGAYCAVPMPARHAGSPAGPAGKPPRMMPNP